MMLVLAVATSQVGIGKTNNLVSLGIVQAPLLKSPAAGFYVRLLISLEIAENIDRRSVTRHLTRLRDMVMLDLHQNPIPPNRKDNEVDIAAIESRLLDKVSRVVGTRLIKRVRVYELTKNQVCDKSAPVGTWSSGCLN